MVNQHSRRYLGQSSYRSHNRFDDRLEGLDSRHQKVDETGLHLHLDPGSIRQLHGLT